MNTNEHVWRRLAAAARQAPSPPPPVLPYGLAERVVARWLAGDEEDPAWVWAVVGRRALVGALAVTTGLLALSYLPLTETWTELSNSGPLLEVLAGL